jgi:hypothetical protein
MMTQRYRNSLSELFRVALSLCGGALAFVNNSVCKSCQLRNFALEIPHVGD